MKAAVIIGTRPEAIKLAPLILELGSRAVDTRIISTGQHESLLSQALDIFDIKPSIILETMSTGQSLTSLGSRLLAKLEPMFRDYRPDYVFVQGDTSSAFFGALAAFNEGLKVAHIEAGMRTGDMANPFPEEVNRKMISSLASLHFAATKRARLALLNEGVKDEDIFVTGNTVVDAIQIATIIMEKTNNSLVSTKMGFNIHRPYVFVTCHRRENFGRIIEGICSAIIELAVLYSNLDFIFAVHPNPNARNPIREKLKNIKNIKLIDPLDYISAIDLVRGARLIITDSGGIQEEAPSFSVPVVIMRKFTERMEGVEGGFADLAGQEPSQIISMARKWLEDDALRAQLKNKANPYGDGKASKRIVSRILNESFDQFDR